MLPKVELADGGEHVGAWLDSEFFLEGAAEAVVAAERIGRVTAAGVDLDDETVRAF
ncbi:hypothetical protein QP157_21040 [Sphingomonas sp. LR61]